MAAPGVNPLNIADVDPVAVVGGTGGVLGVNVPPKYVKLYDVAFCVPDHVSVKPVVVTFDIAVGGS